MNMNTPMVSVRLRLIGSCWTPRHCVHDPCAEFQTKGGLVGARGVDPFSGMLVWTATKRLTIILMASIREGPQANGVTRVRVRYSWTSAASLSKRLRRALLTSGLDAS